ncbi:hypothetical protein L9S41_10340 [Geoalkalibacter halelectricus]|uniref:Cytochrome c7-like domain-containing protein n=1 Tax=Geoalkalibacter halelectricus TaxID=2847045 RepID=A0ABY5ZJE0_9BACT|nr:hypothetical protein [Geoalkalibacter halelectricus]UWZ78097.1 hypothetical protein L9S41_10340 [Geoalkalibacter halelectricus]
MKKPHAPLVFVLAFVVVASWSVQAQGWSREGFDDRGSGSGWDGGSFSGSWAAIFNGAPTEEACRECHEDLRSFPRLEFLNPDKHHLFLGQQIPQSTVAPNGQVGGVYDCFSCHVVEQFGDVFQVITVRNCLQCHTRQTVTGSPRSSNVHHLRDILRHYSCGDCHDFGDRRGGWGR